MEMPLRKTSWVVFDPQAPRRKLCDCGPELMLPISPEHTHSIQTAANAIDDRRDRHLLEPTTMFSDLECNRRVKTCRSTFSILGGNSPIERRGGGSGTLNPSCKPHYADRLENQTNDHYHRTIPMRLNNETHPAYFLLS